MKRKFVALFITYVIVTTDVMVLANIINSRGKVPVPGTKIALVAIAIPAPPAVLMVPPIPDAEPAKWGRTDIIPEVALGNTIPFPMPIKETQPKNERGIGGVNKNKLMQSSIPNAVIKVPVKIILFNPNVIENLPDKPLPII